KLSKLVMVSHVAAKDEATIFMDNKDGVGPSPVAPMNFTVQGVDDHRNLDILQLLQVARVTELLLPGAMGRIIFRRVRLTGVEQKDGTAAAGNFLLNLVECRTLEGAHGVCTASRNEDDMTFAAKVTQANHSPIKGTGFKIRSGTADFSRHGFPGI